MGNRPKKVKKTRISVTLTKPYLDALDRLVQEGFYFTKGEAVIEGLRLVFRRHGLDPLKLLEAEG